MRWKVAIAAIGAVAAAGATLMAMSPQSGGAKAGPPVVRPSPIGPFEIYADGVERPGAVLGVTLREVDTETAKANKLAAQEGAVVESVQPGSAAEKGGLRAGDIINSYDGERVRSASQLTRMVRETPPGRFVKVGVTRDGKKIEATVSPADRSSSDLRMRLFGDGASDELQRRVPRDFLFRFRGPDMWTDQGDSLVVPMPRNRPRYPLDQWTPGAARLGVVVQELTPQLSEYFGVKTGALVASVSPNSAASRAGLKAGDVITALNGKAVSAPGDVAQLIHDVPDGQDVAIGIVRDKKPLTLKAKLAAARLTRPT
jgi:serine protease Do